MLRPVEVPLREFGGYRQLKSPSDSLPPIVDSNRPSRSGQDQRDVGLDAYRSMSTTVSLYSCQGCFWLVARTVLRPPQLSTGDSRGRRCRHQTSQVPEWASVR